VTPEQRAMRARIAAHSRWAKEADPQAATAPARRASLERFVREVDPRRAPCRPQSVHDALSTRGRRTCSAWPSGRLRSGASDECRAAKVSRPFDPLAVSSPA